MKTGRKKGAIKICSDYKEKDELIKKEQNSSG